eukprot:TRINITY_DN1243_c0_g1_i2.p1 TRINITY_DN1243_c0_g1~~TRINITY_DN1243_c0_g1_i2.p1  ORF type:complete len:346 (+),score=106.52 TRINITY_DN1243_c0_g1_i2:112-1038(+)
MVAFCVSAAAVSAASPFAPGTLKVQTSTGQTTGDTPWHYNAYMPITSAPSPVLVFVTGWGGLVPMRYYHSAAEMWAAKGITTVGLWRIDGPAPVKNGASLVQAIDYLQRNMSPQGTTLDWDTLLLGGHSAGNHVWCDYLLHACSTAVKGVVMIDPVDGYDPFGIVQNFCTATDAKLNYTVPAVMVSTGLDPVPGPEGVACAPEEMSNMRYYNAWAGPVWAVNATQYGHLDIGDEMIDFFGKAICASDSLNHKLFKQQVAGVVAAFVDVVKGNASSQSVMTDASVMPVNSTAFHTLNGAALPFTGGCRY